MQANYLDQMLALLGRPVGWAMVLWLAVLLIAATQTAVARWGLLATIMFAASLGKENRADRGAEELTVQLISPLNEMQALGRPITMALLVTAAVVVLITARGPRGRVAQTAWWLLPVQGVLLLKMLASGMTFYAVFSALTYALWFYVFGIGLSQWVRTPADLLWAIRTPCVASALFCIGNVTQAAVDPTPLLMGSRFTGTTGNPQFAAVLLGLTVPATAYLAAHRGLRVPERAAWGALLLAQAGLTVWTGSRTGALMAVLSVCLVFRRKFGHLVFVGIMLAGAVAWVGSTFNEYVQVDYLVRTDDTRSEMWAGMWYGFANYPVFGMPQSATADRLGFAENSWLAMACACGMIGLAPLIAFGAKLLGEMGWLGRLAAARPRQARLADLLTASLLALLVGSVFEAYLLGVINFPLPFLYFTLAIIQHLRSGERPPARYGPGGY